MLFLWDKMVTLQTTSLQTYRAKLLPKEAEASAFTIKLTVQIVSNVLTSHIPNNKPCLQCPQNHSQMSSKDKYFMKEKT